jgi:hypothetical protein
MEPALWAAGVETILFTGGSVADYPAPELASLSLGRAALRSAATLIAARRGERPRSGGQRHDRRPGRPGSAFDAPLRPACVPSSSASSAGTVHEEPSSTPMPSAIARHEHESLPRDVPDLHEARLELAAMARSSGRRYTPKSPRRRSAPQDSRNGLTRRRPRAVEARAESSKTCTPRSAAVAACTYCVWAVQ